MPSLQQLKYYNGVLLKEIAERFELEYTDDIRDLLHEWMKVEHGILTTAINPANELEPLTTTQMEDYLLNIRIYFAQKFGWELKEPHEDEIEQQTMEEFLAYKMRQL